MRTDKTDKADDADQADQADNIDNVDNTDNGIVAVMIRLQAGGHPKLLYKKCSEKGGRYEKNHDNPTHMNNDHSSNCRMEYTQVDDNYYWSGDGGEGMHYNELVSIKDLPKLDTENSERIADYDYAYRYCLNMGYNAECEYEKGFGFFMHCFRNNRPYTGGCVAVPENIMKFVMQHMKPGCRITIDSLENFGGDLDA